MKVFRIGKAKRISSILQGIPGRDHNFRWNTRGHPIIYASMSRSLALHEKSANISKPFYGLNPNYLIVCIHLPNTHYKSITIEDLPIGWGKINEYHPMTQKIGNSFTLSDELIMLVPSTIVSNEYNVLINPRKALEVNLTIMTEQIDDRIRDLR